MKREACFEGTPNNLEDREYLEAIYRGIGTMASEYIGASLGGYANTTVKGFAVSLTKNTFTDLARYVDLKYLKHHNDLKLDLTDATENAFLGLYASFSLRNQFLNFASEAGRARGRAWRARAGKAEREASREQTQQNQQNQNPRKTNPTQPISDRDKNNGEDPAKAMTTVVPPERKEEERKEQNEQNRKDSASNNPPDRRETESKNRAQHINSKEKVFKHKDPPDRKMNGYLVNGKEDIPEWAKKEAKRYGIDLELFMDWYGGGIKERVRKWLKYIKDKDYREKIKEQKKVWKEFGMIRGGKGVLVLAHNEVAGALVEGGEIKGVRVYQDLFMVKVTLGGIKAVSLEDYAVDYKEDVWKGKVEFPLRAGVYKGYKSESRKGYTIALRLIDILEGKGEEQHEVFGAEALRALNEPATFFHPGNMPYLYDGQKVHITDSDGCITVPGIYDPDVTWQNPKDDKLSPEKRNTIRRAHYAAALKNGAEIYDVARDIYLSAKEWVSSDPMKSPVTFIVENEIGEEVKGFIEYNKDKDELTFWMTGKDGDREKITKKIHRR